MNESFSFKLFTQPIVGAGESMKIGEILNSHGYKNIAVIVDECVGASENYEKFRHKIETSATLVKEIMSRGTDEPDYDYLDVITDKLRDKDIDCIIGLGGGSTLDITKAVAVLLTNPGKGIEYRGFDMAKVPGVPVIAIPTTAGTGSEVTINAVFTDKSEMKKLGINGNHLHATHAILDPQWTLTCPRNVSVSSGMDAMTHTLESFVCKKANTLTRMFAREAFRLLYHALPALVREPENMDKRGDLLLGSYLGAISLFNSGSGISGAFSYPIGVHFKVPHGIGGAIPLIHVADYNVQKGYYRYSELYDLMGEPACERDDKGKAEIFVKNMYALADELEVPRTYDSFGITKANLPEVSEMMRPMQGAFDQNPVHFGYEDAVALLEKLTD